MNFSIKIDTIETYKSNCKFQITVKQEGVTPLCKTTIAFQEERITFEGFQKSYEVENLVGAVLAAKFSYEMSAAWLRLSREGGGCLELSCKRQ